MILAGDQSARAINGPEADPAWPRKDGMLSPSAGIQMEAPVGNFEFQPVPMLATLIQVLGQTIREYDQAEFGDRLESTLEERFDRNLDAFCERYLYDHPPVQQDLRNIRKMLQQVIDGHDLAQ